MIIWSNILVPITSMLITVFATLYTVSKRVENENKEKHKPYITLDEIEQLDTIDEYKYYLVIESNEKICKKSININLKLNNIGYGVASNIKFYNLATGNIIKGYQSKNDEINQKLFTTFDISINQEKQVQIKLNTEENSIYKVLCIYQDLNGNVYDFIININIKTPTTFDYSVYQRTSHSYNESINKNITEYNSILSEYKKI